MRNFLFIPAESNRHISTVNGIYGDAYNIMVIDIYFKVSSIEILVCFALIDGIVL